MREQTQEFLKKFERDYEVYVDATDALSYWIMYARLPKTGNDETHHMHHGKKYVSGPNEEGNVLILPEPMISDAYQVESWGKMESFDDFVKKGLARILSDKTAADNGQEEGCGSSCS